MNVRKAIGLGYAHRNSDILETAYFLSRHIHVDGALNRSGERFQNNAISASGFTGFVKSEG